MIVAFPPRAERPRNAKSIIRERHDTSDGAAWNGPLSRTAIAGSSGRVVKSLARQFSIR
jgi:hypothetical protein